MTALSTALLFGLYCSAFAMAELPPPPTPTHMGAHGSATASGIKIKPTKPSGNTLSISSQATPDSQMKSADEAAKNHKVHFTGKGSQSMVQKRSQKEVTMHPLPGSIPGELPTSRISSSEKGEPERIMEQVDSNKDGRLSMQEVEAKITKGGGDKQDIVEVRANFKVADLDGDGDLTLPEELQEMIKLMHTTHALHLGHKLFFLESRHHNKVEPETSLNSQQAVHRQKSQDVLAILEELD